MNTEKGANMRHWRADTIVLAAIFIVTGLMMFLHRQGRIDTPIYNIVISWQMLLIVLGAWSLVCRRYSSGVLLVGVGAFFLIPVLTGAGAGWAATYWPLLLVLAGVLILLGMLRKKDRRLHLEQHSTDNESTATEDGFVYSDNSMGSVKQIVLDPVFKGARLRTSLGSTILDLRHTSIAEGQTFIDVECSMGAIEIYVPYEWAVVCDVQPVLAGCEDRRFRRPGDESDPGRKLIIRGKVTLGGIEIKN